MKQRFSLPPTTDRKAVEAAMNHHYRSSFGEHQQFSWEWTRIHWFLQGVRSLVSGNFNGTNLVTRRGAVTSPNYIDVPSGQRRVRFEKTLAIFQTEVGRLLGINVAPSVERSTGISLDGVREAALASAVYNDWWSRANTHNFQMDAAVKLVAYGTAGLGAFQTPVGGTYGVGLTVVPPWELLPLPGGVTGVDQVGGVCWRRWVPLQWLKDNFKDILKFPDKDKMRIVTRPGGVMVQNNLSPRPTTRMAGFGPIGFTDSASIDGQSWSGISDGKDYSADYVEFKEGWVWGDDYSCLRWNIMLGEGLALDIDYTSEKDKAKFGIPGNDLPIAPLHVARYVSVGSFWGRGLADRLIHLNREVELATGDLLQNNRDVQRMTKTYIPAESGIELDALQQNAQNQFVTFQPNPVSPNAVPFILKPGHEQGQILGNTVAMLNGMMNDVSQQGPMLSGEAPGSIQASGGVQQLIQQGQTPLVPCAESYCGAMIGVHKSALGILRRTLPRDETLSITRIDESLVGLKFDRTTGTLTLDPDALPAPQKVRVTTADKLPTSREVKLATLKENLSNGIISPVEFTILAWRDGIADGLLNRAPYESWKSAWLDVHAAFGDGNTPGPITFNPMGANLVIEQMVLMEFMASPTFKAASPAVRARFEELRAAVETGVGVAPRPLTANTFGQLGQRPPDMQQLAAVGMPPGSNTVGAQGGLPPEVASQLMQ